MTTNADNSLEQDLLFAVIKEKYGHLLTNEQLEGVRGAVNGQREVFRALRAVRLTNDVEPFSNFRPYRGGLVHPWKLLPHPLILRLSKDSP